MTTTRKPIHLYLIPVVLLCVLFFVFQTKNGATFVPPTEEGGHDELSVPYDLIDAQLDQALEAVQADREGEREGITGDHTGYEWVPEEESINERSRKVQLDLTVMSKCPDAVSSHEVPLETK
jgi:hypothetical protein